MINDTGSVFIIYILFAHWLADFVCQSHWMATNKSENIWALLSHVLVYMLALGGMLILFQNVLLFICVNFILHLTTDYFTSKINTYFWNKQDYHNFFVSVGFDQFIHATSLILTYEWILK